MQENMTDLIREALKAAGKRLKHTEVLAIIQKKHPNWTPSNKTSFEVTCYRIGLSIYGSQRTKEKKIMNIRETIREIVVERGAIKNGEILKIIQEKHPNYKPKSIRYFNNICREEIRGVGATVGKMSKPIPQPHTTQIDIESLLKIDRMIQANKTPELKEIIACMIRIQESGGGKLLREYISKMEK